MTCKGYLKYFKKNAKWDEIAKVLFVFLSVCIPYALYFGLHDFCTFWIGFLLSNVAGFFVAAGYAASPTLRCATRICRVELASGFGLISLFLAVSSFSIGESLDGAISNMESLGKLSSDVLPATFISHVEVLGYVVASFHYSIALAFPLLYVHSIVYVCTYLSRKLKIEKNKESEHYTLHRLFRQVKGLIVGCTLSFKFCTMLLQHLLYVVVESRSDRIPVGIFWNVVYVAFVVILFPIAYFSRPILKSRHETMRDHFNIKDGSLHPKKTTTIILEEERIPLQEIEGEVRRHAKERRVKKKLKRQGKKANKLTERQKNLLEIETEEFSNDDELEVEGKLEKQEDATSFKKTVVKKVKKAPKPAEREKNPKNVSIEALSDGVELEIVGKRKTPAEEARVKKEIETRAKKATKDTEETKNRKVISIESDSDDEKVGAFGRFLSIFRRTKRSDSYDLPQDLETEENIKHSGDIADPAHVLAEVIVHREPTASAVKLGENEKVEPATTSTQAVGKSAVRVSNGTAIPITERIDAGLLNDISNGTGDSFNIAPSSSTENVVGASNVTDIPLQGPINTGLLSDVSKGATTSFKLAPPTANLAQTLGYRNGSLAQNIKSSTDDSAVDELNQMLGGRVKVRARVVKTPLPISSDDAVSTVAGPNGLENDMHMSDNKITADFGDHLNKRSVDEAGNKIVSEVRVREKKPRRESKFGNN